MYIDILEKYLDYFLDEIRRDISNDLTIFEYIKDEKELDKLLSIQAKVLKSYLEHFKSNDLDIDYISFYKDLNVPYTIIYRSLNLLKKNLIQVLNKHSLDKVEAYEFSLYIQNLSNEVAKIYIKKELKELKLLINSPFKKYLLFQSHIDWLEGIIQSIEEDDMSKFILISHSSCEFSKVLLYPESLMVCINKNLCVYLEDLHKIVHKLAESFYSFYTSGKYSESYFIFRDLKEQILKFKQSILELYYITYSNLEYNFFKVVELMEASYDIYLTMIDIKALKGLNTIYGEQTITNALNILSEEIDKFINHRDKNLLIKGMTSDFYMLSINFDDKSHREHIEELIKYIKKLTLEIQDIKINFDSLITTIKIERFSEFKDVDFIKMFSYIKKEAKKKDLDFMYINNIRDIANNILNEAINEKFIYKKINNKDIDIMFQPIFESKTNDIFAIEVLGRIKDNDKLISAGMFIDKMYEMNLIIRFDIEILNRLIEYKKLIERISKRVFINISFQSLLNNDYLKKLQEVFQTFDNVEIILELTEQKFIENYDIIEKIHNEHNIFFAVDDFGSGYSSLKSLVDLVKKGVLKILKIDGTLVQDIATDKYDKKIIKVISNLGKELELLTVAEYIEDQETLDIINELNINLSQGYYLSKPKTIEELLLIKD